jgi:hypothetical protein
MKTPSKADWNCAQSGLLAFHGALILTGISVFLKI